MSLIVTIDIGDGRTDNVKVSPNTDLKVLASRFCAKHSLPVEVEACLIQEIKRNISSSTPSTKKIENQDDSTLSTSFTAGEKHYENMLNGLFRKTPDSIPIAKKPEQNIGTKLYDKGLRYLEILESKLEKFRKLKQESEDRNLTFSPKVNKSKYRSNAEILLKSGVATEEKLEKMRGEKLNSEINECTFSPQINRKSQILSLRRKSPIGERESQTPFSYDNTDFMNV